MKGFCLRAKSESKKLIKNYIIKIRTQFDNTVKLVRHDGAREYVTNSLKAFYEDQGRQQSVCTSDKRSRNTRHPDYYDNWTQFAASRQVGQVFLD